MRRSAALDALVSQLTTIAARPSPRAGQRDGGAGVRDWEREADDATPKRPGPAMLSHEQRMRLREDCGRPGHPITVQPRDGCKSIGDGCYVTHPRLGAG